MNPSPRGSLSLRGKINKNDVNTINGTTEHQAIKVTLKDSCINKCNHSDYSGRHDVIVPNDRAMNDEGT